MAAGGSVNITASGAGADSDITLQGANVKAGNSVTLNAEDEIKLLAAKNTADQHSTNSSKSGSIGVNIGTNGVGVTVSASKGRGNADGSDVTWSNTQVKAGQQVSLNSGSDTTLQGAVVAAPQITANVGGNLNIESLQDTSKFDSKQSSLGGSVTIGAGAGGSFNASKSNTNSDYASVTEQSGLQAGDAGFAVKVAGNTSLTGGAITSTQKAVDDKKNTFTSQTLKTLEIQNSANYNAKSVGINLGTGFDPSGKLTPQGTSAGIGKDSGNASSTTAAAISGIAGNKEARTGDAQTGIGKIFDADKVQKSIDAQVQITQTFGREASKAVGDYAEQKLKDAIANNDQAGIDQWKEGGSARVALHTVIGGLTGGVSGAAGAGAASSSAELLNDLQARVQISLEQSGVDPTTAKALAQGVSNLAAVGTGFVVAGTTGAATAFNSDANNRTQHVSRRLDGTWAKYLPGEHRATVVERDRPDQFPEDIRQTLGEPVQLPSGKYGYILEDLKSSDGKLFPVANGSPNLTGNNTSPAATLNALSSGGATVYRTDPDNFPLEDQLLRNYANDIKTGATLPYPSGEATFGCYADFCGNFTNSNTMADKRAQQAGYIPPNTGTANVPGGVYDRDVSPWDALLNTLTQKLNQAYGKATK